MWVHGFGGDRFMWLAEGFWGMGGLRGIMGGMIEALGGCGSGRKVWGLAGAMGAGRVGQSWKGGSGELEGEHRAGRGW